MEKHEVNDVAHELVNEIQNGNAEELSMYEEIAPIYEFLFGHSYDYTSQAAFVKDVIDTDAPQILEGGCGTGHLTEQVAHAHPSGTVRGVDLHSGMIERANNRLKNVENATAACRDVLSVEGDYDAFVAMGLTPHLDDEALMDLAKSLADILADGGVAVLDYKDPRYDVHGRFTEYNRDTEDFSISSRFTTLYDDGKTYYAVSYEFDEHDGDTYYTGELMPVEFQRPELLRDLFGKAGFSDIEIQEGILDQSGVIVAMN